MNKLSRDTVFAAFLECGPVRSTESRVEQRFGNDGELVASIEVGQGTEMNALALSECIISTRIRSYPYLTDVPSSTNLRKSRAVVTDELNYMCDNTSYEFSR